MGQSAAKFSQVVRQLREDNEDLTSVEFESVHLSEKELRKLGDALRTNRYVYIILMHLVCDMGLSFGGMSLSFDRMSLSYW